MGHPDFDDLYTEEDLQEIYLDNYVRKLHELFGKRLQDDAARETRIQRTRRRDSLADRHQHDRWQNMDQT